MDMACTQCQKPLADGDICCGGCGSPLVDYAVTLDRHVLFLGDTPHTQVKLTITNRGQRALYVASLSADQPWVHIPALVGHNLTVRPDSSPLELWVEVDLARVAAHGDGAEICVKVYEAESQCVKLVVTPLPEWDIELGDSVVVLDDAREARLSGRLRLQAGYARIEALEASAPWLKLQGVAGHQWPCTLSASQQRDLLFEVVVDKQLLRGSLQQPSDLTLPALHSAEVWVKVICQAPEVQVTEKCTITWIWPPTLQVRGLQRGALQWQLFQGRRRTVTLSVANRGELDLEIRYITPNADTPWLQLGAVHRREDLKLPVIISPRTEKEFHFTVDSSKLYPGEHKTSITITSNSYATSLEEISVVVLIERMPIYDGVVAIDFGTTNSCVTVFDRRGHEARMIQPIIDGMPEGDSVPSAILYERLHEDGTREYRIGSYAKEYAVIWRESVVQSIRRHLGMRKRVKVQFGEDGQRREYSPEEIAQDFIARILESVEDQLRKKIEECVITYPATFAPAQLHAIIRVFTKCGVRVRAMIPEPVAAAMNYILDRQSPRDSYTLMVYDMGKGTTDITLLQFCDEIRTSGHRVITPQILGVDGRRWFGGDDITEAIARDLCRQFNEWLALHYGETHLIQIDPAVIDAIVDWEEREYAWLTRSEIWRLAEREKIEISNAQEPSGLRTVAPALPFMHEGSLRIVSPIAEFSEHRLNELIRAPIDDTMAIMRGLLHKANLEEPDIILLASQSSRLQFVREAIAQHFPSPGTCIVRAGESEDNSTTQDELKACVVKGACRVMRLLSVPGPLTINDAQMRPMATARIGLESTTYTGQPCFREVIAAGEPVGQWKLIKGVTIDRQSEIRILENSGTVDDLQISDATGHTRPNPEIEELGRCSLNQVIPQDITDEELRYFTIEMLLDDRHEVVLRGIIVDHVYQFVTERWLGWEEVGVQDKRRAFASGKYEVHPMAGSCKICQWTLADDDVYCSWCSNELMGYKVRPENIRLFLEDRTHTQVRLTIENQGQNAIRLKKIKADQPWVHVPDIERHGQMLLPDDPPFELVVDVDLSIPSRRVNEATISIEANDSKAHHVTIVVTPRPEFEIEVGDCTITLDNSADQHHSGKLRLKAGYAHIERLEPSVPWVKVVGAEERTLDSRSERELMFEVIVNKQLLRQEELPHAQDANTPQNKQVLLKVVSQDLLGSASGPFTVTWIWPPTLQVRGLQRDALQWQLFQGRRRTVTMSVANRGGLDLEIQHIAPHADTPWLQLSAAHRREEIKLPVILKPRDIKELHFTVDGSKLPLGEHKTSITITSNSYAASLAEIPVVALVEQMPIYDGVVAVDFGTTNSCVAVFDRRGNEAKIIQPIIDGVPEGDAVPSVILYERLDNETKEYRIGSYAREYAVEYRESVIQSIKRFLGMRKYIKKVLFFEDGQRRVYRPEDVAQDIVTRMFESVEHQLGKKIEECVITHPSTFAPSQLHALSRVFMNCGVRIRAMYHEPVAAALNYILDRPKPEHPYPPYTLMVYDFGGGTTDITLLKVHDEMTSSEQRVITPQILGVDGKRWFGGDDVTEAVARELCHQFNEWFEHNYGGQHPLHLDPSVIDAIVEPEERERAWQTYSEILRLAEREKIDISNAPESSELKTVAPAVPFMHEGSLRSMSPLAEFSESHLNKLIKVPIDGTIAIMQGLLHKANLEYPDIILLAGQSSRLRLVKEAIAQHFPLPGTRIVRAGEQEGNPTTQDELKACVAKGACRVMRLVRVPGRLRINDAQMRPMATARIGIESTMYNGQPCFQEVIAAGEPVGQWKLVKGVTIYRQSDLRILENSGTVDDLQIRDDTGRTYLNPEIEELGIYHLSEKISTEITDDDISTAKVEMMLDDRHEVALQAVIESQTQQCVIEFVTERWQQPEEEN